MGYIELVGGGGQDHVCPSADKRQAKITQEADPNSKRDLFLRTPHRILMKALPLKTSKTMCEPSPLLY